MKSACSVVVVVLALLAAAPAQAAGGGLGAGDRATLERYAAATWHSFDLMADRSHAACRPTTSAPTARARLHLADEHRGLSVGDARRARPGDHRRREAAPAHRAHARHAGGDGARRAQRPVLQLVRPGDRRAAHTWPPTARASSRSSRPSTTAGWRRRSDHGRAPSPGARRARAGDRARDGLRRLLRPGRRPPATAAPGPSSRPAAASPTGGLFFTCHRYDMLNTEPRIASYVGIAQGQHPAASTTSARSAPSGRAATSELDRDAAGRHHPHLPRRRRLRGAPTPTAACTSSPAGAAACSRR